MSGSNSGSNTSKMAVPQAKEDLAERLDKEAVALGEMVKKMIMKQEEQMKN